jgi:hypothetical protein
MLLDSSITFDWGAGIKALQRAWIGRSEVHRRHFVHPLNKHYIFGVCWDAGIKALQRPGSGAPRCLPPAFMTACEAPEDSLQLATAATEPSEAGCTRMYCAGCDTKQLIILQGANIRFELEGGTSSSLPPGVQLEVFTTRPDTVRP